MIKLEAFGIPETIQKYQMALDAAFAAGKVVGAAEATQAREVTFRNTKHWMVEALEESRQ